MLKRIAISTLCLSLGASALASFAFDGTFSTLGDYDAALAPDGWYSGSGNGSLSPSDPLPNQNNVEDNVRVVPDPTAGSSAFSGGVLYMEGEPNVGGNDPMNHWLTHLGVVQPGLDFSISFDFWIAAGIPADPSELFVRLNRWGNYIAIKPDAGAIEGPGLGVNVAIPTETVHSFKAMYDVDGSGVITRYDYYLNGSHVGGADGSFEVNQIELRSQKVATYLDNLSIDVIPEPGTLGLVGAGLGALLLLLRRRR